MPPPSGAPPRCPRPTLGWEPKGVWGGRAPPESPPPAGPGPVTGTGRTGRRWAAGGGRRGGPHLAPCPGRGRGRRLLPRARHRRGGPSGNGGGQRPGAAGAGRGGGGGIPGPGPAAAAGRGRAQRHRQGPQGVRVEGAAGAAGAAGPGAAPPRGAPPAPAAALPRRRPLQRQDRYTYEIAPVFVLMEEVVLAKLRELVGWGSGDGIFCPGGSLSNMYAMNVARFQRFPEGRQRGSRALPRLALFASQESHYSIEKGAAFLGIGTDNVFFVRADERAPCPSSSAPRAAPPSWAPSTRCRAWRTCASATASGSTWTLPGAGARCSPGRTGTSWPASRGTRAARRAWGSLLKGWGGLGGPSASSPCPPSPPPRADSVAWNPHKMLAVGLQCSALLLRDTSVGPAPPPWAPPGSPPSPPQTPGAELPPPPLGLPQGLLQRCHGAGASYLFQRDKFYDVAYDTGDKTLQCGRRVDCLKLWLLWKAVGTEGLERRVDRAFACTRRAPWTPPRARGGAVRHPPPQHPVADAAPSPGTWWRR
uniref:Cysteine sulfinic acid decarboxylase n=1 Tax=Cairina moschata TaxID=8855 RepID=A0A8C3BS05_CAIMO